MWTLADTAVNIFPNWILRAEILFWDKKLQEEKFNPNAFSKLGINLKLNSIKEFLTIKLKLLISWSLDLQKLYQLLFWR